MENNLFLSGSLKISADPALDLALFGSLFRTFTAGKICAEWSIGAKNTVFFGACGAPKLEDGEEYALQVELSGFCIVGRDSTALARGLSNLLLRLFPVRDGYTLPCGTVRGSYKLAARTAHLCIFPENSFAEIHKWVRLFGILQYTHLVLEFWGTYQFDCFPEYAWADHALSKEQIRVLVREGKAFGMEMIPMLNHLGHASACRMRYGKHVLLDRHPEFETYFTPDGWAWNIDNPEVSERLTQMRTELYELFEQPRYFHLGLDEAYIYHHGYITTEKMAAYIGSVVDRVLSEGVTPLLWGDMLIPASASQTVGHINNCCQTDDGAETMLRAISKKAILCDWQYEATQVPIETAVYLQERGFSVLGCCWYKPGNIKAYINTAITAPLTGAMLTTWHTLQTFAKSVTQFARNCGMPEPDWWKFATDNSITATVIRKSNVPSANYEDYGFAPDQLQPAQS